MAYADDIRTPNSFTGDDLADLIEGIFASTYGLDFTAFVPTYGGGGSLTYTSVTTTQAERIPCGKAMWLFIESAGTLGGSADADLRIFLGFAVSTSNQAGYGNLSLTGPTVREVAAVVTIENSGTSYLRIRREGGASWPTSGTATLVVGGLFQTT